MPFIDRVDAGHRLACRLRHLRTTGRRSRSASRRGSRRVRGCRRARCAPRRDPRAQARCSVPARARHGCHRRGRRARPERRSHPCRGGDGRRARDRRATRTPRARTACRFASGTARSARRLRGKTAVLVDDGMATGSTALAACRVARQLGAERVVLAVPVAPEVTVRIAERIADEVVCLESPSPFFGVGEWYHDFSQVSDEEVVDVAPTGGVGCRRAAMPRGFAVEDHATDCPVELDLGDARVMGDLVVPKDAVGVVVFAHGSGSSRHSARNRSVARVLNHAGIGTLLFDLLTPSKSPIARTSSTSNCSPAA